jgi:hypothetical protein
VELELKHLLALALLVGTGSVAMALTLLYERMRDVMLFCLVVGAVVMERFSVSLYGVFWYRGTSRGLEISALDLAPLCLLVASLLVPRAGRGRFFWPASFGLMLTYFAYCTASVWFSTPQLYGVWELAKMLRGLLVFLAAALTIRSRRELGVVVLALCCTACLECAVAVHQRFVEGAFRTNGTLDHENTLSTYLCTIGPVLIAGAMSRWSVPLRVFAGISWLLAAGAELLTVSRLGIPVFFTVSVITAGLCTRFTLTKHKIVVVASALAGLAGFLALSWDVVKTRYAQSDIRAELMDHRAFETRGVYWRLAFAMVEDFPYGVGLNNWPYYVAKKYGRELGTQYRDYDSIRWIESQEEAAGIRLAPAADSLPALTLGELGVTGFVLLTLIWLAWLRIGSQFVWQRLDDTPTHRLALGFALGTLGLFLQSVTEWTYRQTPVLFTSHVLLGGLAGLYSLRRSAARVPSGRAQRLTVGFDPFPVARAAK